MVRESSYCVIETSDAECVSYAKTLDFCSRIYYKVGNE